MADLTHLAALVADRDRLDEEIKGLTERREVLDAQLKQAIGDDEVGLVDGVPVFTWKSQPSTRLNQQAAKSYLRGQGVLDDFMSTSTSRVFRRVTSRDQVVDAGPVTIISTDAGF